MRVIGGRLGSRRVKPVPGYDVRPTPDRLRETLFDVLAPRIEGALFVDAYAGTGAVGIEALSRGARRAVFIENNRAALAVLRENLRSLDLIGESEVVAGKVSATIGRFAGADIVFLDPPYPVEKEYRVCLEILGAGAGPGLVIAQHASRFALEETWGTLNRVRVLKQGDNTLSFYERNQSDL